MTLVTCRLTAKNRDQLRNPTLGDRAWATLQSVSFPALVTNFASQRISAVVGCAD